VNIIYFKTKQNFHSYLSENYNSEAGIWIKFDKRNIPDKLTPDEALKEALMFGWIDGQIKRLDEDFYLKYFTKRRPKSIWSTRNKKIAEELINSKEMQPSGKHQIDIAKKDGRWEKSDILPDDFSVEDFKTLLQNNPKALDNYLKMSPSIQKTYAISYYVLKKEDSRNNRLAKIIERLLENKKPM
jgi:uncharacterized protein YdeI (YjbR/CyaY-like superfamily)